MRFLITLLPLIALFSAPAFAQRSEAEVVRELLSMGYTREEISLEGIFGRMRKGTGYPTGAEIEVTPYKLLSYYPLSTRLVGAILRFGLTDVRAPDSRVDHERLLTMILDRMELGPFDFFTPESAGLVRTYYEMMLEGQYGAKRTALVILSHFNAHASFATAELWRMGSGEDRVTAVRSTVALLRSPDYRDRAFPRLQRFFSSPTTQKMVLRHTEEALEWLTEDELDFFRALRPKDVKIGNRQAHRELQSMIRALDVARAERTKHCGGALLRLLPPASSG